MFEPTLTCVQSFPRNCLNNDENLSKTEHEWLAWIFEQKHFPKSCLFHHFRSRQIELRQIGPLGDLVANWAPRRFGGKLGPTLFGAVANWAPADWANLYKVPVPVEFIDWYWTHSVYWRCQYALWARSWEMCILLNICIYSRIFFFYICIF